MALATTYCRAQYGMDAPKITVETHLANGLPSFNIVGLAQTAVKESKDRVRCALINSHFEFPLRRITINLAPAELPKQGGRYDLAIAIGILAASGQIPKQHLEHFEFLGELSLSGELRAIQAALPTAVQVRNTEATLIFPLENADELAISEQQNIYCARHLLEVSAHIMGTQHLSQPKKVPPQPPSYKVDFNQVHGQTIAKRALCIAASGRHHLLMSGPPGSGKTLLANCLATILPPMSLGELIETASIYSLDGKLNYCSTTRSFCTPHHSASAVALVGGGNPPKPGEISKAHNGVLFLDELPEFQRSALESLREPMENGEITINRATHKVRFLSHFMLVAAMNLCPCGFYGSEKNCRCTHEQIQRYHHKLSGPLLDRIDMYLFVRPPKLSHIQAANNNIELKSSSEYRTMVQAAHELQIQRQQKNNSLLTHDEFEIYCQLSKKDKQWLTAKAETLKLSMRTYYKVIKVARTIADLEASQNIQKLHLQEAFSLKENLHV